MWTINLSIHQKWISLVRFIILLSIQTRNYSSRPEAESTNQKNSLDESNKKLSKRPKHDKNYKNNLKLSSFLKEALIGLILGDVFVSRHGRHKNARLVFDQSKDKHSDYLYYLYDLFEPFVGTEPKSTNRKPDPRTGLIYNSLVFRTFSLPCFTEYHTMFYPNGKKIIPLNIEEYLTEIGLAFWIMDDGGKNTHGDLILHTNSYTLDEVKLLISVLNNKYNLSSKLYERRKGQWAILIPKKELPKVRKLVSNYIHSSMEYKIKE
jgi:hypothetical protein